MDNERIEVEVALKESDLYKLNFAFFSKRARITTVVILLFLGLTGLYSRMNDPYNNASVLILPFFMIFFAGSIVYVSYNAKKRAHKLYESSKALQSTVFYTFSLSGVEAKSTNGSFTYAWNELYNYRVTKETLLLYVSSNTCFIIPKRIFDADDARLNKLREYFKKIPVKKEKNPFNPLIVKLTVFILIFTIIFAAVYISENK